MGGGAGEGTLEATGRLQRVRGGAGERTPEAIDPLSQALRR